MTTNATAGRGLCGRPGTENLPLEQTMNHTDPTADPVTDARDRLRGMALSLATGSGPIVDPQSFAAAVDAYGDAVRAAVVAPPPSRAELRDRIAEALHQDQTPPPTVPWSDEAPMDREFFLRRADAVLAVLPEPTSRAAVLLDAADRMSRKAAKLTNGLDDLAIFVGKARAAEAEILNREADVLRRLAAEAQQQTDTETPTDRAAVERAFAERLATELKGCCSECDACIEIAQHLAGDEQPETPKSPPMDPVHILGIDAAEPAPVAQQPADYEEHVCKPGTGLYWCPTSGQTESDCHGGFDVCCDRPDLHRPIAPVQQPAAADGEETLCRCGHGRAYHDAKYFDPQCRLCPEDGERSWRHPFTPADVPRP